MTINLQICQRYQLHLYIHLNNNQFFVTYYNVCKKYIISKIIRVEPSSKPIRLVTSPAKLANFLSK
ncbi:hypothetical protein HanRHA438_Chr12g0556511 [Helianthus annuus]|nr:hypothetical protein HanRHA438_Chr12g0556511 [Helianthus annuus]